MTSTQKRNHSKKQGESARVTNFAKNVSPWLKSDQLSGGTMSPLPRQQSFQLANFADMDLDTVQDDKNSYQDDLDSPNMR